MVYVYTGCGTQRKGGGAAGGGTANETVSLLEFIYFTLYFILFFTTIEMVSLPTYTLTYSNVFVTPTTRAC